MSAGTRKPGSLAEPLITAPAFIWLVVFFVVPTVIIFAMAFRPSTLAGGFGEGITLDAWRSLSNPNYPAIVWRTIWLSVATTVTCLLISLPSAYYIARLRPSIRHVVLMLIIIPFWTNFLIRVFAWKSLMHPDGFMKQALLVLGLVEPSTQLLYNDYSILVVLMYTHLPFAILPIYAAAEKFDYRLLEAARDLGATALRAFWSIFIPGVKRGLITALLMVLIPSLGSYVIPDIMGGPTSEMIGNKIAQRTFADRNLPQASALAAMLTLAVFGPLVAALMMQGRRGDAPRKPEAK